MSHAVKKSEIKSVQISRHFSKNRLSTKVSHNHLYDIAAVCSPNLSPSQGRVPACYFRSVSQVFGVK
ncbi:hypothetical protein, partial [Vibrio metschnikovii]|uniref:hypothetical protein n=1 Tax=Vibrio metschnikovii TaxID=28172 RepID=UPI002FCA44B3